MNIKLLGIGALLTVFAVALGLQPIAATAAETYTIFNVDKDLTDDPHRPHVKRFWSFQIVDNRFVPVDGEWTEGWANLVLEKTSIETKPSLLQGPKAWKTSPHRKLWEKAVKDDVALPVDKYTGDVYLQQASLEGPVWQKHAVLVFVVPLDKETKAYRAILKYEHATDSDHGACTHGDN